LSVNQLICTCTPLEKFRGFTSPRYSKSVIGTLPIRGKIPNFGIIPATGIFVVYVGIIMYNIYSNSWCNVEEGKSDVWVIPKMRKIPNGGKIPNFGIIPNCGKIPATGMIPQYRILTINQIVI
jgi:hypothetical protein